MVFFIHFLSTWWAFLAACRFPAYSCTVPALHLASVVGSWTASGPEPIPRTWPGPPEVRPAALWLRRGKRRQGLHEYWGWLIGGVSQTPYRGAQVPLVRGRSGLSHPRAPSLPQNSWDPARWGFLGSVVLAVMPRDRFCASRRLWSRTRSPRRQHVR